jgi:hypothetical protein
MDTFNITNIIDKQLHKFSYMRRVIQVIMRLDVFWTINIQFLAKSLRFHLIYYPVNDGNYLIMDKAAKEWLTYLSSRAYSPGALNIVKLCCKRPVISLYVEIFS